MFLGKVIGSVVATKKDETMRGHKLLMVRPMLADVEKLGQLKPGGNSIICVDTIGAGEGEMVMFVQGSSARQADGLRALPTDAAIVGCVDSVTLLNQKAYQS